MLIGYGLPDYYVGVIMGQVIEVNDADFDMITKGNEWVLVDFWAPWCGPCKAIAPILHEIADERDITIAKVNTDVNQMAPGKYNVRGIPNLILFHNGEPVEQITGAMPKPGMDNWLNRHMI